MICTSTAPIQELDIHNLDIALDQTGLDKPCVLIVKDSHEDLIEFLEAKDQVKRSTVVPCDRYDDLCLYYFRILVLGKRWYAKVYFMYIPHVILVHVRIGV